MRRRDWCGSPGSQTSRLDFHHCWPHVLIRNLLGGQCARCVRSILPSPSPTSCGRRHIHLIPNVPNPHNRPQSCHLSRHQSRSAAYRRHRTATRRTRWRDDPRRTVDRFLTNAGAVIQRECWETCDQSTCAPTGIQSRPGADHTAALSPTLDGGAFRLPPMTSTTPTTSSIPTIEPAFCPPRRRAPVVVLALVALVAAACTTNAHQSAPATRPTAGPAAGVTSRYGSVVADGALATTKAAVAATHDFADMVNTSTAAFVAAVTALQSAVASSDVAGARAAQLAAQAAYDSFRVLQSGNAVNASTLDELASDVPPGQSFGGLHAVERDLWDSGPLAADVDALAGQAPVAQYLLSRERLGPEAIAVAAVDQLTWAVDVALPHSQEHWSHLGLVDVAATIDGARRSFSTIEPLGRLVSPGLTATVHGQFDDLSARIARLGPPTTTADTTVAAGDRLGLSQALDATASTLARLATRLTPYGTAGGRS